MELPTEPEDKIKHRMRVDQLRKEYGVQVIAQVEVLDAHPAEKQVQYLHSISHITEAYRIEDNGTDCLRLRIRLDHISSSLPIVIVLDVALGWGTPFPSETGYFRVFINREPAGAIALVKHSECWTSTPYRVALDVKQVVTASLGQSLFLDKAIQGDNTVVFGLLGILVPPEKWEGLDCVDLTLAGGSGKQTRRWLRVGQSGSGLFHMDANDVVRLAIHGRPARRWSGEVYAFGDIHAHSGESHLLGWGCGAGSRRENFTFAREVARLDFFALTEHDWQMDEMDWEELQQLNEEFDRSGQFSTLHAYEWTSCNYGHRNVYFSGPGGPLVKSSIRNKPYGIWHPSNPTPQDLWAALDRAQVSAFTAPHHTSVVPFPLSPDSPVNLDYDRVIEVYSSWGSSLESKEPMANPLNVAADRVPGHGVEDFLSRGHLLGMIASSDAHDGHPGLAQGTDRRPHLYHWLGSGRVAVIVDSLERDQVFQALYNRRCYATTGEPILVNWLWGEHRMGDILSKIPKCAMQVKIEGTQPITSFTLVHNGSVIYRLSSESRRIEDEIVVKPSRGYYYLCIRQIDGEMAWTSPIWII